MIRFLVICYGQDFSWLLENVAVKSLLQPRNKSVIPSDSVVALYTDDDRNASIASPLGRVEQNPIEGTEPAVIWQNIIVREIALCIEQAATLIVVSPENYWGDGSLENLLAVAGDQNVCVAAPHPRVDKNKFLEVLPSQASNAELVKRSMANLHPSWVNSNIELDQVGSGYSGVSWKTISPGMYAVSHLMPNCWLARFVLDDLRYFRNVISGGSKGLWDHFWPERLAVTGRQRVIGSSDAFFVAELTPAESHNVPMHAVSPSDYTVFHRSSGQITAMRNVVSIWREG